MRLERNMLVNAGALQHPHTARALGASLRLPLRWQDSERKCQLVLTQP